ncbi:plasmid stabilization system protein [Nostoc sp. 'Peltigera membranacea cyanobiont' 210A]|uniref:type II toxin-antitoxin system RelE/ParE family toxin n=1 Tax=Nostoc sp. 'Peltigera membranacea cyanobiont' 210A TaxID=2014529 RepID=UPI000B954233|nr:type II toxin-antitoxin system RelE/ParE family toxin [Nostoc sp. 'Peltigera membranacea cyanobiont' 210A]OYD91198.1 plasmid stabilization system protein [Nostoc sp. 'Peltigera membranacea cyanobiont' 210A]
MTKRIVITPKASLDIDEYFAYIAQENPDTALLFFDSIRETFAQLARMPGMGSPYPLDNLRLQGLRKWAVKGFKKYLIFYFERDESIEVVRILYAGQDIEKILEQQ